MRTAIMCVHKYDNLNLYIYVIATSNNYIHNIE